MTTYSWPQTINGVTFTAADFAPYAYVTGLPNLIGNMVASFNTGNPTLSTLGVLTPAADKLAYFSSASTASLTDLTPAGRALLDDADAAGQRTTLGLGTAATQNTGTSGATVPLLNGNNVFSGTMTVAAEAYLGGAAGSESLRALSAASMVNRIVARGAAASGDPFVLFDGSDSAVNGNVGSKGAGAVKIFTNTNVANVQLRVTHTAAAVNHFGVTGAATAGAVVVGPAGSDVDVSSSYNAKGGGSISLVTGGGRVLRAGNTNSAVNYAEVNSGAAGVNTTTGFYVGGSDSSIFLNLCPKGNGGIRMWGNGAEQARTGAIASAVNYLLLEGGAAGNLTVPAFSATGSDSNVFLNFYSRGSSGTRIWAGAYEQARVDAVASAVNFVLVYGSTTGNGPSFAVGGVDTNADAQHRSKGTGAFTVVTGGGIQFKATHVAGTVNWAAVLGAATTNAPEFYVDGSDANVFMLLRGKGNAGHRFFANGVEQVRIAATASAVNYCNLSGGATGNPVSLSAAGTDANIGWNAFSKGSGACNFFTNGGARQGVFDHAANAVNYIYMTGGATNSAVLYGAEGSDSNISVQVRAKGTGDVTLSSVMDSTMLRIGRLGSGLRVAYILNGTAPSVAPSGGVYLWAESGVLKAMGASGVVTTLAA